MTGPARPQAAQKTTIATLPKLLTHTAIARPHLCPEIRLHLATPETELWRCSEREAAELGFVDPYWAFCWAGGQAVARWLLDATPCLAERRVLDFGSGGGVVAITAALAGAQVVACDIDPMAALAAQANAALNRVELATTTENLLGRDGEWDWVFAGDVTYDAELTRSVLEWLGRLACTTQVVIGDPGRGYVDATRLRLLAEYDVPGDNDADGSRLTRTQVYAVKPR